MSLPESFLENLKQVISEEEIAAFTQSLENELPVSIRLNPKKPLALAPTPTLALSSAVSWCETGFYLPERKKFTFDPFFHAGCYYVQEAGSMVIEQALKQHADLTTSLTVLDLCASPGGKTTHLLSLISDESVLVSNEVISSRIAALEQNVIKWGTSNCILTQNDPADFSKFSQLFDVIVVDAPCSGEGMFRKHDHAVSEWSEENVSLCAARQQRILDDVWPCLKEGGLLLYSTCTFNLDENEKNISTFLQEHEGESLSLNLPSDWKIFENKRDSVFGYRMMPHRTQSEGFFLSVIRKTELASSRKNRSTLKPKQLVDWKKLVLNADAFESFEFPQRGPLSGKNQPFLFPKAQSDFLAACLSELRVHYAGTELGEVKGKDFIPAQALAQSNFLNPDAFPICEVDHNTAIKFLQKEAITSTNSQAGIQLVTFEKQPLGFIKNIGNRSNNLFPKNWRILSKHIG